MSDTIKMTEKDMLKDGTIIGAEFLTENPKHVISLSPAADLGLAGGIPEGSWVAFSGKEKFGKTQMALHLAMKAQQVENGQRPVFFFDVEHRLKKMQLEGTQGLRLAKKAGDTSGMQLIRSNKDKILTAEEFLTAATNILRNYPNAVIIIDSTSALCSAKEITSDITGSTRAIGPKILAAFCRQMASVVPVNNSIVVSIQHLIANTSGYGPTQMEDSGRKIQYQGDVKMRGKSVEAWVEGDTQVGQILNWTVNFSALGPPGAVIKNWFRYGVGIDEVAELIDIALDFGLIDKAGAWMTCSYLLDCLEDEEFIDYVGDKDPEKAIKFQGRAKLYQFLSTHKHFSNILYNNIRTMI